MNEDIRKYVSNRVIDGVRVLTEKQHEEHLARLKKQLEKRSK